MVNKLKAQSFEDIGSKVIEAYFLDDAQVALKICYDFAATLICRSFIGVHDIICLAQKLHWLKSCCKIYPSQASILAMASATTLFRDLPQLTMRFYLFWSNFMVSASR